MLKLLQTKTKFIKYGEINIQIYISNKHYKYITLGILTKYLYIYIYVYAISLYKV